MLLKKTSIRAKITDRNGGLNLVRHLAFLDIVEARISSIQQCNRGSNI